MQARRVFLLGVVGFELVLLALVGLRFAPVFAKMVEGFGGASTLPRLFRIVTAREYPYVVGLALALVTIAVDRLATDPKRRVLALAIVATLGGIVLVATLFGLYQPIFDVAGNIR